MKLIVGLGNPGLRYKNTRHNIGYKVAERLAEALGVKLDRKKFHSLFGETKLGTERVIIAKPLTYMNSSGVAVKEIVSGKKIAISDILVICDEANLDLGSLRMKRKGSSGGHNGMDSVIENLGTSNFSRLRIGIGPRPEDKILTDFVLERFTKSEAKIVDEAVDEAVPAAQAWAEHGIEYALREYNKRGYKG